jgi:pyruvate kinase
MLKARETGMAQPGDTIVITGGMTNGRSGNTNMIKIETVPTSKVARKKRK